MTTSAARLHSRWFRRTPNDTGRSGVQNSIGWVCACRRSWCRRGFLRNGRDRVFDMLPSGTVTNFFWEDYDQRSHEKRLRRDLWNEPISRRIPIRNLLSLDVMRKRLSGL